MELFKFRDIHENGNMTASFHILSNPFYTNRPITGSDIMQTLRSAITQPQRPYSEICKGKQDLSISSGTIFFFAFYDPQFVLKKITFKLKEVNAVWSSGRSSTDTWQVLVEIPFNLQNKRTPRLLIRSQTINSSRTLVCSVGNHYKIQARTPPRWLVLSVSKYKAIPVTSSGGNTCFLWSTNTIYI
jgi:hypothetical protein